MIKLSYSTHGLPGSLFNIIDVCQEAGYEGIELAFQENQFDPRKMSLDNIKKDPLILNLKKYFKNKNIKPACINTATLPLIPGRLHEPTVISLNKNARQERIEIIQKGIEIAKVLSIPIVGFGSGFIREEHVLNPDIDPLPLLIDSIKQCLKYAEDSDVILTIEPEPGMMIEKLQNAIDVIEEIDSPNFALHIDLCHVYCSEHDYINKIAEATHKAKYLHISDTSNGYNMRIINKSKNMKIDLNFAAYLIFYPENDGFLFIDKKNSIFFHKKNYNKNDIEKFCEKNNTNNKVIYLNYNEIKHLPKTADFIEKEKEIKTFLLSMPKISYNTLDKANPIIHYLRSLKSAKVNENIPIISKMVANSITGKVHYHDIPGNGDMDLSGTFNILKQNNFSGYGTVELYHHGEQNIWKKVLNKSKKRLDNILNN